MSTARRRRKPDLPRHAQDHSSPDYLSRPVAANGASNDHCQGCEYFMLICCCRPQGQDRTDYLCKRQEQVPIYEAKGPCDTATPRQSLKGHAMTSGNVNTLVGDLVAMAKAFEELPAVQQALTASEAEANRLAASVQAREESILRLKSEIEALHAKVRSTEVERDDAEMRFLEADEKLHSVVGSFKAMQDTITKAVITLEPPKPEPEAQHEEQDQATQQAISHIAEHGEGAIPQGQSEANPHVGDPISGAYSPQQQGTDASGVGAEPSHSLPVTSFEEVPKSDANPIPVQDTSTTEEASGSSPSPVDGQASQSVDDVGYHNEPDVGNDWSAWNAWCERMRARYGTGAWPQRPDNAAPSVA